MKTRLLFASALLAASSIFAADVTIKNLATTASLPTVNDYTVFDGTTAGTRKFLASGFTFLTATRTTLAALSITNAADGAGVLVLGASAAGDGGGAAYFWSASSVATPNGNTVILPASAPGTGRWLKAVGGVGAPGVSTLGGVFSNAGASHQFLTAINTDGSVSLAQPGIADVSGLGSMASQNSNAVAITGGSISGITDLAVADGGTGASTAANARTNLGVSATGADTTYNFRANNLSDVASAATSRTNLGVSATGADVTYAFRANNLSDLASASTARTNLGLGSIATQSAAAVSISGGAVNATLGATTPNTAAVTTLNASGVVTLPGNGVQINGVNGSSALTYQEIGNANGTLRLAAAADGHAQVGTTTADNLAFLVNGSEVATLTASGLNGTQIGATTPAFGGFTTLNSTGGALNGSLGATTPATIVGTTATLSSYASATGILLTNQTLPAAGTGVLVYYATTGTPQGFLTAIDIASSTYKPMRYSSSLHTFAINGAAVATVTSDGLNGALGGTTPAAVIATTFASSSLANLRTSKASLNLVVNVKDYGAVGNGSTDDTTAINSAIAALTNYSALVFPPGRYRITAGLTGLSGLSYIKIAGIGATIYNDSGASGANTFVFDHTCSGIEVTGINFTGSASIRGSGIHIRSYCSQVNIHGNYFSGCSDFAVHVSNDGSSWSSDVVVADNIFSNTFGDGVHVAAAVNVAVVGNVFEGTGDDSIAVVADDPAHAPNRVQVTGNAIYNSSSRGIVIAEGVDINVTGNNITTTAGAGIEVGRYLSTTAYNTRVVIASNKIMRSQTTAGPLGSIWLKFCAGVTVEGNKIDDPANGNGIAFLDCNDAVIQGNQLRNIPSRAIGSDDATTTNVAANCYRVWILNNSILYSLANEAIYVVAPTGKTINDFVVAGNNAGAVPGGNYIYYNRVANGKVVNNTQLGANTIGAGGTVSGVTLANNN